eukprot:5823714-Amphidinium_carterae.1
MQYSASGEWQQTRQRGSSETEYVWAVAVSGDGKVYVAGYTDGSLDGQSSAGFDDAFLMQYDSASSTTTSSSHSSSTSGSATSTTTSSSHS